MKTYLFILVTISMILLASCNKEESAIFTAPESSALNITATLENPATRATISAFPNGAELGLFVTTGHLGTNYNNVAGNANVKSTLNNSTWTQSPAVYLSPAYAKIYAYYPYSISASSGSTIPVESRTQTDFLYGTHIATDINSNNPVVNLTMNHALTLVQFKIRTENYFGEGLLSKIEIANKTGKTCLFGEGTLNVETGIIANTPNKNLPTVLSLSDYYLLPANSDYPEEYPRLLVLPVAATSAAGDIQINFTIDGKTYTYDVPSATKWEKGKINTYFTTLSGKGLIINPVTITDWTSGASGSVELL